MGLRHLYHTGTRRAHTTAPSYDGSWMVQAGGPVRQGLTVRGDPSVISHGQLSSSNRGRREVPLSCNDYLCQPSVFIRLGRACPHACAQLSMPVPPSKPCMHTMRYSISEAPTQHREGWWWGAWQPHSDEQLHSDGCPVTTHEGGGVDGLTDREFAEN